MTHWRGLIAGVAAGSINDICFTTESFFDSVPRPRWQHHRRRLRDAATALCNNVIWGTLSPRSWFTRHRCVTLGGRCGRRAVVILGTGHWGQCLARPGVRHRHDDLGAYPGHPRTDIQSGTGSSPMHACSTVPKSRWCVDRSGPSKRPGSPLRRTVRVMRRFVAFEAEPSAARFRALGFGLAPLNRHYGASGEICPSSKAWARSRSVRRATVFAPTAMQWRMSGSRARSR